MREWLDGNVYCVPCITCPHDNVDCNGMCHVCVRRLHTIITFEGPRIADITLYAHEAWREYSVPISDLLTWSFAEESQLMDLPDWERGRGQRTIGVTAAPPHHRFTSSGGSR